MRAKSSGKNPSYSSERARKKEKSKCKVILFSEREKKRKWTCSTLRAYNHLFWWKRLTKSSYSSSFFFLFGFYFASDSREIQMFQPFHSHYFTKYVYIYFCVRIRLTCTHPRTFPRKKSKDRKFRYMEFFRSRCYYCYRCWQPYLIAHHNSGKSVEWCRTPLFNIHRSFVRSLWAIRAHERTHISCNHSIYAGIWIHTLCTQAHIHRRQYTRNMIKHVWISPLTFGPASIGGFESCSAFNFGFEIEPPNFLCTHRETQM